MKLIIDIPEDMYISAKSGYLCGSEIIVNAIKDGTPLDDVKAEIDKAYDDMDGYDPYALGTFANRVSDILDNIGKAESEDKG